MTQNMEKYFGFKVHLTEDLRPEDEVILRNKAKQIVDVEGIDLNKHHVYLHQLVIKSNSEHFGVDGGLSKRLQKLNIEFHLNERQRESGDIRFMNHVIQTGIPRDVKPSFSPEWIGYEIPISYFQSTNWFQNAIIAFVNKEMQQKKRKIKVVVTVQPLESYLKVLRGDRSDVSTNLDLRFSKNIQLSLPFASNDAHPSTEKGVYQVNFNNYGNVGAFGTNPTAYDFINNQQLLVELQKLREVALKEGENQVADIIDKFTECANQKKNLKALDYLKKMGEWSADKAEKLGMVVATEAIKIAMKSA